MSNHLAFALSFSGFIIIRVLFHRKAKRSREGVELKESNLNIAFRALIGLGYTGILTAYVFYPPLLSWSELPMPLWLQWLGTGISILSVLLIWWVQWALDVQFDTTLHIQDNHQLITHGPYHWVRHPMYTSLFLLGLGWMLLTSNWFVGGPLMITIPMIVFFRINNEEAVLIEEFGDKYLEYIDCTGRFLPRI